MKIQWARIIRFFLPWPQGDWLTERFVDILAGIGYFVGFVFIVVLGTFASGIIAHATATYFIPMPASTLSLYERITTHVMGWRPFEHVCLYSVIFFWIEIVIYRAWCLTVDAIGWLSAKGKAKVKRRENQRKEVQDESIDFPYGS